MPGARRYNCFLLRDPLVAPLAAIAAGILLSRFVPFGAGELATAVALFLALGAAALWRRARFLAGVCCLLGFVAAGALCDLAHRPPPRPELDAEGREPVILSGCVVEPPVLSGDRARFTLELAADARAQVTLYLGESEQPPALRYGQRLEVEARVRKPQNFRNPGDFDYARYLARKDVYWTASARAAGVTVLPGECGSRLAGAIKNLRGAALDRLARLYPGKPYETGMMQAILIGETYQLEKVWTESFRRTGTIHALVISGTHVAVLAAFLMLLLRLCLVPQPVATLVTVLAAWLYSLVTGWQAPCVRSAAGLTLFMIGWYFYRERRILNLLAAVALGFLLLDPEQMFEPSFQLSFLAVAVIGAFAAPLLKATVAPLKMGIRDLGDAARDPLLPPRAARFRVEMRLLAETLQLALRLPARAAALAVTVPARACFFIYELVVISAVVQMGLALPMVTYFHRLGLSGLSANIPVVPLFGWLVPLGFVAIFTGWPWVGQAAGVLLAISRAIVEWHAAMEPNWRVPTPPVWLAVAFSAALVGAALAVYASRWWRVAALAAVAVLLGLMLWHPFPPHVAPGRLELDAIDVGQGDSFLLAFPAGNLMLLDAGGFPVFGGRRATGLDTGEDVVSPYLWSRSIRRLDVAVVSHLHDDHAGGLPALVANFHPRELWIGAIPDSPERRRLLGMAAARGVAVRSLRRGQEFAYGGARIEVLAPAPDYQPAAKPANDDSLVLRVRYGRCAFLLTGDIERRTEEDLLAANADLRADVLKVAHHGSRTSTSEAFLDAVHPALALISVGAGNTYGYPTPTVLARLAARRIQVLRTDLEGQISISTDGRRLTADTAAWAGTAGSLYSVF
jgi:competence protein ComEC